MPPRPVSFDWGGAWRYRFSSDRTDLGGLTNTDAPLPATQPTWWGLLVSGRSVRYVAGMLLIAGGY